MQLVASKAQTDSELVTLCRQGDRGAWRQLYDRYASSVFRFISALGVPIDDREDAAQDVFIAVYRSLGHFRGEAQLSTWIYRIAARHAGRLGRRRKVREVVSAILMRQPPPVGEPDPTERSAQLHFVDKMLSKLSPKKRMVFVLFELEGVPVEEIATIVGCPENTVWSRLHHARAEMLKLAQKSDKTGDVAMATERKADPAAGGRSGRKGKARASAPNAEGFLDTESPDGVGDDEGGAS